MQLILVRHTEAVEIGTAGARSDFDRTLSGTGLDQAVRLAESLAVLGVEADLILTSPYPRARQTAEPLSKRLRTVTGEFACHDYLAAGELRRKKLTRHLAGLGPATAILVGHNPDLEEYIGWLIGGPATAVRMEKGSAALVSFRGLPDEGEGTLELLISPGCYCPPE